MILEPSLKTTLPSDTAFHLIIVGAGGTGSQVAINMARLAYDSEKRGISVSIQIFDDDIVEEKNVGRQMFGVSDIGQNKAEVLATRLSYWLGVNVSATPTKFSARLANDIGNQDWRVTGSRDCTTIVIGCVDNWQGRKSMNEWIHAGYNSYTSNKRWWVDCGNDEYSGTVLVGNAVSKEPISINRKMRIASALPLPSSQIPELIKPVKRKVGRPKKIQPSASCAELAVAGVQSLYINQLVANAASQIVSKMVLEREVNILATYVNLNPPSASSVMLTESNLVERVSKSTEIKFETKKENK